VDELLAGLLTAFYWFLVIAVCIWGTVDLLMLVIGGIALTCLLLMIFNE